MSFEPLTDYRTEEQLARMDDGGWATLAREILSTPPSRDAWNALTALFSYWRPGDARDAVLRQAAAALEGWDESLTTFFSQSGVLYDGDTLTDIVRLGSGFDVYRRGAQASKELYALASSEHARSLRRLSISRSELSAYAWDALLRSPNLGRIESLKVRRSTLGHGRIDDLFSSPGFPRLRRLEVSGMDLDRSEIAALSGPSPFPELRRLDFSSSLLRDDGARLIAGSPWLPRIDELVLRDGFLGEPGIRALIESPLSGGMRILDVAGNDLPASTGRELQDRARTRGLELVLHST